MDLLKSYEIDECSSQELVKMLSKESLLGSDECAMANFSIRLSNPAGASETGQWFLIELQFTCKSLDKSELH